jgi:hypothetical protein
MTDPKYANLSALHCLRKLNQRHYGGLLNTPFDSDYIHRKLVVEKKDHELKSRPAIGLSEAAQGFRDFGKAAGLDSVLNKTFLKKLTEILPEPDFGSCCTQLSGDPDRETDVAKVQAAAEAAVSKLLALPDETVEAVSEAISATYAVYAALTDFQVLVWSLRNLPELANAAPGLLSDKAAALNRSANRLPDRASASSRLASFFGKRSAVDDSAAEPRRQRK